MKPFEINQDQICEDPEEGISAILLSSENGPVGLFSGGPTVPAGCAIANQELTITIDEDVFGPFAALPASVGPLTSGSFAGTTFTINGTSLTDFTIIPDQGYEGVITVTVKYFVEGTVCGETTVESSVSLEWADPVATIEFPVVDNGGGNLVFNGVPSSPVSCPGGITSYLWTVFASNGTTELVAGVDYTLNSPDLMQSTLDVTFDDGNYVASLSVTTDCGTDTTTYPASVISPPVRAFINSSDLLVNAVIISTGGSLAGDGVTDISNDPTAFYTDAFSIGECGATVNTLFTISGNAGDAIAAGNFSNWNGAFSAGQQAAIIAAVTGSIGNPGYSIDKEVVRDQWVLAGLTNTLGLVDGDEICVSGTVEQNGVTSTAVEYEIQQYCTMSNYSIGVPGTSGPLDPAGAGVIGIGNYYNENGLFGSGGIAAEATTYDLYISAQVGTPDTLEDVLNLVQEPTSEIDPATLFVNFGEITYQSLHVISNAGLATFGMQWHTVHDNTDPGLPDRSEKNRLGPTANGFSVDTAACTVRSRLAEQSFNNSTNPPVADTINADDVSHANGAVTTWQWYPVGTNGITLSGTENPDPALASASPQNVNFAPGGTAIGSTDLAGLNSETDPIDRSSDLYYRTSQAGLNTGLPYVSMGSARVKII